jgi:hypothetical protein
MTTANASDYRKAPEIREAEKIVEGIVQISKGYRIQSPAQYTAAAEQLRDVKAAREKLEGMQERLLKPLKVVLEGIGDLFRPKLQQITAAEQAIKAEIARYADEQERLRIEEQRRLDEKAKRERQAAEDRAKREREQAEARAKAEREEAERKRREQEEAERIAREKREAAARAANEEAAARRAGDEEQARKARERRETNERAARQEQTRARGAGAAADKAETKAERIVERGEERAQAQETIAATAVAPVIRRAPPRARGVATMQLWKAEVTDLSALVKAIAKGEAPLSLIQPNLTVINAQARSLRSDFRAPGVRVWQERNVSAQATVTDDE